MNDLYDIEGLTLEQLLALWEAAEPDAWASCPLCGDDGHPDKMAVALRAIIMEAVLLRW